MKRRVCTVCFILTFLLITAGCVATDKSNTEQNDKNLKMALRFLEDKGYKVVSNEGEVGEYVLKKEYLLKLPYQQYWGVQKVDASDYLDKTIETYKFIVKNHPLDNYEGNKNKQTRVWVMVCENNVVGGYSLPDEDLTGGVYSLDGKTLEEVTGMAFQDWREQWAKKYSGNNQNASYHFASINPFAHIKDTDIAWITKNGGLPSDKNWAVLYPVRDSDKIKKIINLINSSSDIRESTKDDLDFLHTKHGYPVDIVIKLNNGDVYYLKTAQKITTEKVSNGIVSTGTTYKDRFLLAYEKNEAMKYYTVFSDEATNYLVNDSENDFPRIDR